MIKCFNININTASVFTTITIWVRGPGQGDNNYYWYSVEILNFDIDTALLKEGHYYNLLVVESCNYGFHFTQNLCNPFYNDIVDT